MRLLQELVPGCNKVSNSWENFEKLYLYWCKLLISVVPFHHYRSRGRRWCSMKSSTMCNHCNNKLRYAIYTSKWVNSLEKVLIESSLFFLPTKVWLLSSLVCSYLKIEVSTVLELIIFFLNLDLVAWINGLRLLLALLLTIVASMFLVRSHWVNLL